MGTLEIILELLAERSPRSPHELMQAVDLPPAEVYAALNAASWHVERCAPLEGNTWWWQLTAHAVAERKARAKREAQGAQPCSATQPSQRS